MAKRKRSIRRQKKKSPVISKRTIMNINRRRTTTSWRGRNSTMRRGRNWPEQKRLPPQIYTDETQMKKGSGFRDSGFRHQNLCQSVFIRGLSEFVKRT